MLVVLPENSAKFADNSHQSHPAIMFFNAVETLLDLGKIIFEVFSPLGFLIFILDNQSGYLLECYLFLELVEIKTMEH